jgi:hypothetical protein
MRKLKLLVVFLAGLYVLAGGCGTEDGTLKPVVDTVPPIAPVGLQADFESDLIAVRWAENGETDLAGYRLYSSSDREGPFGLVTANLLYCPWYFDEVLPMQTTYFKVTAVDQSGNESGFSQTVGLYYNSDRKPNTVVPVE